ncbi:Uncharacterised protein [Chromobacterium violaceum]|uniref:Uncharacterized protein n=1 Tax=Chromobacterium violaceum TaxID=536 RepID=A0A3S4LIJ5_CHRVL|nr:Uncharacterised protein [Chromobacterium violaceum]
MPPPPGRTGRRHPAWCRAWPGFPPIPLPAWKRRRCRPGEQPHAALGDGGAAYGHRPFAVAVFVAPADDAAEHAALERFDLSDQLARSLGGEAADRRRRMQAAGQLQNRQRGVGEHAVYRRAQMPHRAGGQQRRRGGDVQPGAIGRQHVADIVYHQAVLVVVLRRIQQLGAGGGVGRRVALALGGAGQREGAHARAVLLQQQLRAHAHQVAAIGQRQLELVAVGILRAYRVEHPFRRHRALEVHLQHAGQHRLADLAAAELLDGLADRRLEALLVRNAARADHLAAVAGALGGRQQALAAVEEGMAGGMNNSEGWSMSKGWRPSALGFDAAGAARAKASATSRLKALRGSSAPRAGVRIREWTPPAFRLRWTT